MISASCAEEIDMQGLKCITYLELQTERSLTGTGLS